jgi:hypothetical protein
MMAASSGAAGAGSRSRPVLGQPPSRAAASELVGRTGAAATGRALVPTIPPPSASRGAPTGADNAPSRPRGPFLAQLIATDLQMPQTRARRRAEPADASTCYAAAATMPAPTGIVLRRSV